MKKAIAILLVLLVAGVVFGVDGDTVEDATLQLTAKAAGVDGELMITATAIANVGAWSSATSVTSLDFGGTEGFDPTGTIPTVDNHFLNLRSNKNISLTIGVEAYSLEHTNESAYIAYDITPVGGSAIRSEVAPTTAASFATFDGTSTNGLTVYNQEFAVALVTGDTQANHSVEYAAAGSYSSSIKFFITSN